MEPYFLVLVCQNEREPEGNGERRDTERVHKDSHVMGLRQGAGTNAD